MIATKIAVLIFDIEPEAVVVAALTPAEHRNASVCSVTDAPPWCLRCQNKLRHVQGAFHAIPATLVEL
ncbi:MAG: hypothetical protein EON57_17400 [Alphaproteobacteria bacterium]|nr:MAG: hypothetical protein EON57_17400 [Alphaproteobacteria bacterium]